jgi:hypothetical protein
MTASDAELDARAEAAVARLEREPVAWIRSYTFGRRNERPEDAWREHEAEWTLFSVGRFFRIRIASGRVVERSHPQTRFSVRHEVRWSLHHQVNVRPAEIARHQDVRAQRRAEMGDEAFDQLELDLAFGNQEILERYVRTGLSIPRNRDQPDFMLVEVPAILREEIRRKTDTRGFPQLLATCAITAIGQFTSDMPVSSRTFGPVDPVTHPEDWATESKALMDLMAVAEDWRQLTFRDVSDSQPIR